MNMNSYRIYFPNVNTEKWVFFFFLVGKNTNIDQTMKKNKSYLKVTLMQKGKKNPIAKLSDHLEIYKRS